MPYQLIRQIQELGSIHSLPNSDVILNDYTSKLNDIALDAVDVVVDSALNTFHRTFNYPTASQLRILREFGFDIEKITHRSMSRYVITTPYGSIVYY